MYLYFDRTGKLKEIINDEALRQGNYEVNKMYIYIDREDVNSIDAEYLLASGLIVGPGNYTTRKQEEIPFNQKRDIYWFKYHTTYNFFVVNLETDLNGNSPLDEAGLVHCNMEMNLEGGGSYALGEVNFNVEVNSVLNQKQVATQEYLSLSNYLFLRTSMVPYTGMTKDLDITGFAIKDNLGDSIYFYEGNFNINSDNTYISGNLYVNGGKEVATKNENLDLGSHYVVANGFTLTDMQAGLNKGLNNSMHVYCDDGDINVECYGEFKYGDSEVATKNDLPKKNVIGTFNTNSFTTSDDTKQCVVTLSDFIANGDLLVVTWGGCFAICPIPASGPGRVCAALWNGNGEAQITRIRYELINDNTKLRLTLPSSFSLPSNFTGYVIQYKIT